MRPQSASALLRGPPLTLGDIIKKGYLQRVRDLVDLGMDMNSRDADGKTPLMLCGLVEPEPWGIGIARNLIERGADLKLRDKSGLNALHHACIYERQGLTKVFLRALDFDLNQADKYGNTALHYTMKSGNVDMIRLLVEFLKRYGMTLHKANKEGLSPLDLAYKQSNNREFYSACIQLLSPQPASTVSGSEEKEDAGDEKGNISARDGSTGGHLSLTESNLKSFCEGTAPRRPFQRPKTALLKRRRTSSVSSASSLSSGSRSPSKISVQSKNTSSKESKHNAQPNEKDTEKIIRCVSLSDFRNTKEFVFKLTAIPYDDLETSRGLPSVRRPQSAWTPRPEVMYPTRQDPFSWRTEFKKLYVEYEFQCSPSWRDAAKTITDQIYQSTQNPQPPEEEEDKMKDRRGRRSSMSSHKNLSVDLMKDKRRQSANIKLRKTSSSSSSGAPTEHTKPSTIDGTMASSSESLNSSNSSKRKDVKTDMVGGKVPLSPDKDKLIHIPAVTETLVGDTDTAGTDDASLLDSNRLSVLSEIDEDV